MLWIEMKSPGTELMLGGFVQQAGLQLPCRAGGGGSAQDLKMSGGLAGDITVGTRRGAAL